MRKVPHAISVLQAAVSCGDATTIRDTIQAYKDRYPHCLIWQYHMGQGLWDRCPDCIQQEICQAICRGEAQTTVIYKGTSACINVHDLEHRTGAVKKRIRSKLQSLVRYPSWTSWVVTSNLTTVPNWEDAVVMFAAGSIVSAVPNGHTVALLCHEGVIDPTLWMPACKTVGHAKHAVAKC